MLRLSRQASTDLWRALEPEYEAMAGRLRLACEDIPEIAPLVAERDLEREAQSRRLIAAALGAGEWEPYWADVREQAAGYAMADIPFSAWAEIISILRADVAGIVERAYGGERDSRLGALRVLDRWLDLALGVFGDVFTSTMEDVIQRQQQAIRELSTPVLQVRPQLLVVPVIGVLDGVRLAQMEAEVLAAVRGRRAKAVVLDVTGVPSLEPSMAERLVRAVVGVRLMGAEVIVSGLSAGLAQALVSEGVDLGALRSVGDLQGGLEAAERLL